MGSMTSLGMHVPMGREARQPWVRAALFAVALARRRVGAFAAAVAHFGHGACRLLRGRALMVSEFFLPAIFELPR